MERDVAQRDADEVSQHSVAVLGPLEASVQAL